MIDKIASSKPLNIMAAIGFSVLAIGLWTDNGSLFWQLFVTAGAIFQIMETYKLYKR